MKNSPIIHQFTCSLPLSSISLFQPRQSLTTKFVKTQVFGYKMIYSEESVTKRQYSSSSSSSSGDLTYTDNENEASHYLVDRKYESKEDINQAIQAYSTAVCRPL